MTGTDPVVTVTEALSVASSAHFGNHRRRPATVPVNSGQQRPRAPKVPAAQRHGRQESPWTNGTRAGACLESLAVHCRGVSRLLRPSSAAWTLHSLPLPIATADNNYPRSLVSILQPFSFVLSILCFPFPFHFHSHSHCKPPSCFKPSAPPSTSGPSATATATLSSMSLPPGLGSSLCST